MPTPLTPAERSTLVDHLGVPGMMEFYVPEHVRTTAADAQATVDKLEQLWDDADPWPLTSTLQRVGPSAMAEPLQRVESHWDGLITTIVDGRGPEALATWFDTLGPTWSTDPAGRTAHEVAQGALESASGAGLTLNPVFDALGATPEVAGWREVFGPETPGSTGPGDPFATLRISAARAFVDREEVRAAFRDATGDGSTRVVRVNSKRPRERVGKTYTREFLAHLAPQLGIQLGVLAIGPEENGTYWRPEEVARELLSEFGHDDVSLPSAANVMPPRYLERLAKRVLRAINPDEGQAWIVLDRFCAEHVPEDTLIFVTILGSLIVRSGQFPHVRLLAVDHPRPAVEPELSAACIELELEPLDATHIQAYLARSGVVDPAAGAASAVSALGAPPWTPEAVRTHIEKALS